jgi:cardiolipin synthase
MVPLLIFLFAAFTDFLDGYIARKYNVVSKLGTALDPLSDKALLSFILIGFYIRGYIPTYILSIIIFKESYMILASIYIYYKRDKMIISSEFIGKFTTAIFSGTILVILISPMSLLSTILIYISVSLEIIAGVYYTKLYFKIIK